MLASELNEYDRILNNMRLELLVLLEKTKNKEALNYHKQAFNNICFLRQYLELFKCGGIPNDE